MSGHDQKAATDISAVLVKLWSGSAIAGFQFGVTSLFEAQADWLKTTATFDAVIKELLVRTKAYRDVPFNFPKGNDTDEKEK